MKLNQTPLITKESIVNQINQMAETINQDYQNKELTVVGVLNGSFIFVSDLVRKLKLKVKIDFIGVSSYEGTSSTGNVKLTKDLKEDLEGKHVLLVEDIVDTGRTLDYLVRTLKQRGPESLKVCTFLSKPSCRIVDVQVDYIGFEIEDKFVVGYGLDYNETWRELPAIFEVIQ